MTYEEAVQTIPCGRYRHFKGNEYEVIGIARHSEDESPMVVYRALYGDGGIWVRPASMWNEMVTRNGGACCRNGGDGRQRRVHPEGLSGHGNALRHLVLQVCGV